MVYPAQKSIDFHFEVLVYSHFEELTHSHFEELTHSHFEELTHSHFEELPTSLEQLIKAFHLEESMAGSLSVELLLPSVLGYSALFPEFESLAPSICRFDHCSCPLVLEKATKETALACMDESSSLFSYQQTRDAASIPLQTVSCLDSSGVIP